MVPFLTEIAQRLRATYPDNLDQVTVVFNNRRSGLFLRHSFSTGVSATPFFLPQTMGMDTLINEWSGRDIVPNELLLFELYDIYSHQSESDIKYNSFEEFMSFGDMMLSDFSEIDLYHVDAAQLFSNLHDIKAIGEWDIDISIFISLFTIFTPLFIVVFCHRKKPMPAWPIVMWPITLKILFKE